ncbi:MAG: FKBP-type peptidyl-prolyl cis-trans isomerase [Bacteroidales bacterium]|nr:FKBP-type peptidyl-prolyl cis-trans isomerase [Bacteroidales bacterium]
MNKLYVLIFFFSLMFFSCTEKSEKKKNMTQEDLAKLEKPLEAVNRYLVTKDSEIIQNYAKRRNWEMHQSETGVWYMIYEKTGGEKAIQGKIATINYNVFLLNGTLCYSSDSLGQKSFLIGRGGVESGLEEGILLMKQGEKARLIMPPFKAHGLLGDMKKIPSRAIVLYEIELVKLTDK